MANPKQSSLTLPSNWLCRPHQNDLWGYMWDGGTRAVAVWHRRAGKDSLALNWAAVAAHRRVATYWHMLPEASQARKAIWTAVNPHTGVRLIDQAFPKEIRATSRDQDMFIRFKNESTWQVVGSDNFDSLVGSPPAGVVFSEYALADPKAWAILRPILKENGGWALFISTPRGRNHLLQILELAESEPGWFGQVLPATHTGIFSREELEKERREYIAELGEQDGQAMFEQEYLCSFQAAIIGAYYGRQMQDADQAGRIRDVPWEPSVPVVTWWDLGIDDSTAIWFVQQIGRQINVIDYYESSGVGLEHYAKVLKEKPYVYQERGHFYPHDVEVTELSTGKSRFAFLASLGLKGTVVPKRDVEDGINSVRKLLPRCYFDKHKCARGIEALREYRREYSEKLKAFRQQPRHDWASHAADAFRYGAVSLKDPVNFRSPTTADGDYDPLGGAPTGNHRGRTIERTDYDPLA